MNGYNGLEEAEQYRLISVAMRLLFNLNLPCILQCLKNVCLKKKLSIHKVRLGRGLMLVKLGKFVLCFSWLVFESAIYNFYIIIYVK